MATSKLQHLTGELLRYHFSKEKIKENYRPVWLQNGHGNRLELDFYMERIGVAIEVQGEQHSRFVDFFHTDKRGFEDRKEWDRVKRDTCKRRGIKLFEIHSRHDLDQVIKTISTAVNPDSKLVNQGAAIEDEINRFKGPEYTELLKMHKCLKGQKKRLAKAVASGDRKKIASEQRGLKKIMRNISRAEKR